MKNELILELIKTYKANGLGDRESHLEALETLKEMKAEISSGADPREVLDEQGLEIDFIFYLI